MTRYGPDWRDFSALIRFIRAHYQCECTGQCGLHQPNPKTRRCIERHHQPARWAKGLIRLTVAHICQCEPPCQNPAHVLAMCQRCHLRIDRPLHQRQRQEHSSARPALATTSKNHDTRSTLDTTQ